MDDARQKRPTAAWLAKSALVMIIFNISAAGGRSQTLLPSPSPAAASQPTTTSSSAPISPLTVDEALRLANTQASTYQSAILNERIAGEDVRQAQAAFKPKVSAPLE